jgi:hypothetical protein
MPTIAHDSLPGDLRYPDVMSFDALRWPNIGPQCAGKLIIAA